MVQASAVRSLLIALFASSFVACAAEAPPCPSPPAAVPVTAPPPVSTNPAPVDESNAMRVAVVPIEDDDLFRVERASLRTDLFRALDRLRGKNVTLVPLAEVDAKVARKTKAGERCVYERASLAERAQEEGMLATSVTQVSFLPEKREKKSRRELWVRATASWMEGVAWIAPWDDSKPLMEAYATAFAALQPANSASLLAGLAGIGKESGATAGSLYVCEEKSFSECDAASKDWLAAADSLRACFVDTDSARPRLLIEAGRCELTNLDDVGGRLGARETCLCKALSAVPRFASIGKRRHIVLEYTAPDVADKPRPYLSIVDTNGDIRAEETTSGDQKTTRTRLTMDGLDDLGVALSRCEKAPGLLVAELELKPSGAVTKARVVSGPGSACVEKQLARGAFDCTRGEKPALIRVAIRWPDS